MDFAQIGEKISLIYVPFLFALCFHEWAHAWMAARFGDLTAERMGRLTLNPTAHMDPLGTVFFPMIAIISGGGFFFGWAKPVPVNERNLVRPRNDMFWIALAGPGSNFILAFISAFLLAANSRFLPIPDYAEAISTILRFFIIINLSLAYFNLIPVHPLDGGKILARFLPENINQWLEDNSQIIGLSLFVLIIADGMNGGPSILSYPIFITETLFLGLWGYFFHFVI